VSWPYLERFSDRRVSRFCSYSYELRKCVIIENWILHFGELGRNIFNVIEPHTTFFTRPATMAQVTVYNTAYIDTDHKIP
jgi:hypothetical protein